MLVWNNTYHNQTEFRKFYTIQGVRRYALCAHTSSVCSSNNNNPFRSLSYTEVFALLLWTRKVNMSYVFVHYAGVCKTHEAEHALVSSCSNCCSSLAYIGNYCSLVVCGSFHRGLLSLLFFCVIHVYSCVIGRVRRLH